MHTHAFGGRYLELVPGERIVNTDRFDDTNLPGEMRTTVTFKAAGEYVLRVQANDQTGDGGGGDLCCWTNALVKVTVK